MAYLQSGRKLREFFLAAAAWGLMAAAGLLAAAAPASAQEPCTLGLTATQVPVEQLTIADFDIEHFESRGLIFTLNISNSGPAPVDARLNVTLMIQLATGEDFQPAAVILTDPFSVPVGGRTLTNLNLGQSKDIGIESFDIVDAARDAIEERSFSTGVLPSGLYTFRFSLENCTEVPPVDIEIELGNPSRVELITPRDGEGTSEFPLFEFYHEGRAARLTVAELTPGQTYEDAIEHDPAMLVADLTTERTLLYTGGRPLQQGKSYVWRVETLTRVAGGAQVELSSPVRSFTVNQGGTFYDALLARLERMYGAQYPDVFRAIRDGEYRPTGEYALDGAGLSEADLLQLLDALEEATDSSELTLE